ncbi:MAG: S-methyl-5'-thioadenosine phosphorylase [Candidatus Aenigmarchaeota archaeon]|nr:S-methyl-5'-thioadenosine phosphorylase [Candidatus Aenigmarchaeota archaeon]
MEAKAKIAIIGGTGLADSNLFKFIEHIEVKTPFGKPSGKITITDFNGTMVAFLPRHGAGHVIPPHKVNYRANIHALKELGVEHILAFTAVGSLRDDMKPGDIVIPDQFIDMTKRRELTFYDGPKVVHISAADPFCANLRKLAADVVKKLGIRHHGNGTYICVDGPRFSTRAESKLWKIMKADVVGMTLVPEAQLAREAEICYLSVSSVTDYDVWADKPVNASDIIETMKKNSENVVYIVREIIPLIKGKRVCECATALKNAEL